MSRYVNQTSHRILSVAGAALFLAFAPAGNLRAGTVAGIPDPSFEFHLIDSLGNEQIITDPGTYSQAGGSVSSSLLPSLSIEADRTGKGLSAADAFYYFEAVPLLGTPQAVLDDPNSFSIPVEITGELHYFYDVPEILGDSPGNWNVSTLVSVQSDDTNQHFLDENSVFWGCSAVTGGPTDCTDGLGDAAGTLHFSLTFDVVPTGLNTIELTTAANAEFTETVPGRGDFPVLSAFADPVVSFDPSFDSTTYALVFSNGVGNSAPDASTPEPTAFSLMLAGGIALFALRRFRAIGSAAR